MRIVQHKRVLGDDVWGVGKTRRTFGEKHWAEPLKWNAAALKNGVRAQVFCASMADVFDPAAPSEERERLWELIRNTPHLDWQLLTKRPEKIKRYLPKDWGDGFSNVWLGTSIEDARVIGRVSTLSAIPAVVHFLSCEPLIGPLENLPLENIQWVIVGGESGPRSRPMVRAWVDSIRAQCREAKVPFFFKQWGGVRKKETGRVLNGRTYDALPRVLSRRKIERVQVSR